MTPTEAYAEELADLRGLLSQPVQGIHLLEFATIPQLESIITEIRPLCAERPCIILKYDPPRENPALLLDRARQEIQHHPQEPVPLLILRPIALPDATHDGPAAADFWKALNFRREAIGVLPAQILLCVDPWHLGHLVDEGLDLLSWIMPKFHLIPPSELSPARAEMLTGNISGAQFSISPMAASARWESTWPLVEEQLRAGPLPSSAIRIHILPLLESALAVGNLVHARRVRDAVGETRIPPEDLVKWHKLNAILACGAEDPAMAEDHANRLLALMESPGDDHLHNAASYALNEVSNLLQDLGRSEFAESLCRHLVAFSTRTFGEEHPNTLVDRNNLANTLDSQGKYPEAEEEHRAVLAIRERILGPEHPHTLASRNNLTIALHSQGKQAEAEKEFRAVLAIQERVLGPEHPDTLGSRMGLAIALSSQGKHAEAEQEHRAVLAIQEHVLGPEHPDVFISCYNLSLCLKVQGKKPEALEFARRALAGRTKVLGAQHPDTLNAKRQVEHLEGT